MSILLPLNMEEDLPETLRTLAHDLMRALNRDAEFLGDFFQSVAVHVAQDDLCVAFGFSYMLV